MVTSLVSVVVLALIDHAAGRHFLSVDGTGSPRSVVQHALLEAQNTAGNSSFSPPPGFHAPIQGICRDDQGESPHELKLRSWLTVDECAEQCLARGYDCQAFAFETHLESRDTTGDKCKLFSGTVQPEQADVRSGGFWSKEGGGVPKAGLACGAQCVSCFTRDNWTETTTTTTTTTVTTTTAAATTVTTTKTATTTVPGTTTTEESECVDFVTPPSGQSGWEEGFEGKCVDDGVTEDNGTVEQDISDCMVRCRADDQCRAVQAFWASASSNANQEGVVCNYVTGPAVGGRRTDDDKAAAAYGGCHICFVKKQLTTTAPSYPTTTAYPRR